MLLPFAFFAFAFYFSRCLPWLRGEKSICVVEKMVYLSLNEYLRGRFGCRVHRVAVDAGFTCPTRDGRIAEEGCLYCDERGARAAYCEPEISVSEQVSRGIEHISRRYKAKKFIVYFQPFTNTYAPVEKLSAVYDEGLKHPDVVGICIGTRPDCVSDESLDLISSYTDRYYVALELGLQSACDETLSQMNRGHSVATFVDTAQRAKRRNIEVCAHVIIGLPGETEPMILDSARLIKQLGIEGVKLHSLYVTATSPLAKLFQEGKIDFLSMEEYVDIVRKYLAILGRDVVVHRLSSDVDEQRLLAPQWVLRKDEIIRKIRQKA